MLFELSSQQRTSLAAFAARVPEAGHRTLDASQPEDERAIRDVLALAGRSAERYPALHRALAASRTLGAPPAILDDATVVDIGRDAAGRATSRTWIASRGGQLIGGAATLLFDAASHELVGFGTSTSVNEPLVQVATRSATAKPAPPRLTAVTVFHTQPAVGPARFGMIRRTVDVPVAGPEVAITDPRKQRSMTPERIVIALCRDTDHANLDADYAYGSRADVDPDRLAVPFVGQARLPYAIDGTRPLELTTRLYSKAARVWTPLRDPGQLLAGIAVSDTAIKWSYPFDGRPIDETSSLQYEAVGQADDTETDFVFQFVIPVTAPTRTYAFTVCSDDTPDEPSLQCTKILDLQFWWHCVAAGTRVALETGEALAIERLDNTHRVRAGSGAALAVEATSRSRHTGAARRIETTCGRSVVVSRRHPVITAAGPVAACDLAPGDPVITAAGPSTVARCEPVDHDGLMCNLKLVEGGERFGSFLANEIAVGDHVTLARHQAALRVDVDYQLARLPEEHHRDFLSALADRTR
jgi:hypothetical protein